MCSSAVSPARVRSERVSPTQGFDPRWRADGRELYYLDPAGQMMAAQFPDDSLNFTSPKPLFPIRLPAPAPPYLSNYVATANGQQFLIRVPLPLELPESRPITVTFDWTQRLSSR